MVHQTAVVASGPVSLFVFALAAASVVASRSFGFACYSWKAAFAVLVAHVLVLLLQIRCAGSFLVSRVGISSFPARFLLMETRNSCTLRVSDIEFILFTFLVLGDSRALRLSVFELHVANQHVNTAEAHPSEAKRASVCGVAATGPTVAFLSLSA